MSFRWVFGINLVLTMILNAIFITIAYGYGGYGIIALIARIIGEPMYILYLLFSPLGRAIWLDFDALMYSLESSIFPILFLNILYVISPLFSAIITGLISDNKITSLFAFITTAMISMIVCIILVLFSFTFQVLIGQELAQNAAILNVVFGSIVNGCFYGLIALTITKNKITPENPQKVLEYHEFFKKRSNK